jgi:hypothetical protein
MTWEAAASINEGGGVWCGADARVPGLKRHTRQAWLPRFSDCHVRKTTVFETLDVYLLRG